MLYVSSFISSGVYRRQIQNSVRKMKVVTLSGLITSECILTPIYKAFSPMLAEVCRVDTIVPIRLRANTSLFRCNTLGLAGEITESALSILQF